MRLMVSLPEDDVAFLDEYAREHGLSRSAGLQTPVHLLRTSSLEDDYAEAFEEWSGSQDSARWDAASGDALTP